jgi:hypothetical protein
MAGATFCLSLFLIPTTKKLNFPGLDLTITHSYANEMLKVNMKDFIVAKFIAHGISTCHFMELPQ